ESGVGVRGRSLGSDPIRRTHAMRRYAVIVPAALATTALLYAQTATPPKTAAAGPLDTVAAGLASGRFTVVDLTQTLSPSTPIIQLPPPFANTPGFKSHVILKYDDNGPAW